MKSEQPIVIRHLTKQFGAQKAVDDVSFSVNTGEVFGFLGPNGAGKTTTIRAMLGITKPTSGSIEIFGEEPFGARSELRASIGFLSGDMSLPHNLTGTQFLSFMNNLYGGSYEDSQKQLAHRLGAQLTKPLGTLSRGNKQKIGLISALAHNPQLLVLDEPTSGLDPVTQHEFGLIIRERVEHGVTVFMSSHILSEIQELCTRVAFIRDGKLTRLSDTHSLFDDQPKNIMLRFVHHEDALHVQSLGLITDAQLQRTILTGTFNSNPNELLSALSSVELVDIRIETPDLEQIFMTYYEDSGVKP